jgi:hypothetical protein
MVYKPKRVNLTDINNKWVTLLTYIQNGVAPVCRCILKDEADAKWAIKGMQEVCGRDPQFQLVVFRRRNEVYVVKSGILQDIVVEGVR